MSGSVSSRLADPCTWVLCWRTRTTEWHLWIVRQRISTQPVRSGFQWPLEWLPFHRRTASPCCGHVPLFSQNAPPVPNDFSASLNCVELQGILEVLMYLTKSMQLSSFPFFYTMQWVYWQGESINVLNVFGCYNYSSVIIPRQMFVFIIIVWHNKPGMS